jgi:hypothetical protein
VHSFIKDDARLPIFASNQKHIAPAGCKGVLAPVSSPQEDACRGFSFVLADSKNIGVMEVITSA